MAITISGENNNDKILASDGVIDSLSSLNIAGIATATTFVGNLTGNVTGDVGGNLTGNVTGNINNTTLLLQTGGYERVRIKSDGKVLIGTDTEGHANADDLTIATSGDTGITIRSGTTHNGRIYFSDATSGAAEYVGSLDYDHNINKFSIVVNGESRLKIDSNGRVLIGTDTEGHPNADDLTIATSGDTGVTIRSGTTHNGRIYFSDAESGTGEVVGSLDYDHNDNKFSIFTNGGERLRIDSDGNVQLTGGTVFLNKHSVGIGTTTQEGRNAGVSTATGTIIYNAETEKVQVYANATWRNVGSLEPDQSTGYYSSLSDAQSNGLSHYWPGNSSTSLISGLQPDDRKGNPTFNNKEHDGYGATNPFFHFAGQTGGDNPTGYRYTHTDDWVGHSFSICYWVKVMQEVTEGESTYVQLGNHSGQRSMFAMSSSGSTNLIGKTITIGDDNANDQIQYEFNNWIHVGVRYNYGANSATYYKNGVQTENHTFNGSLSVGTGNNNIYLGYGYWNSSTSNKESCSRMSDIGIWDSTSINGAVFGEIYRAGRIVKGY